MVARNAKDVKKEGGWGWGGVCVRLKPLIHNMATVGPVAGGSVDDRAGESRRCNKATIPVNRRATMPTLYRYLRMK